MDAMREPHVITGPAEVLHELKWPLPEALQAKSLLVQGLCQVRVEPYSATTRKLRRVAHQLRRHRERRARGDHHAAHRARTGIVEPADHLVGVREDGILGPD